MRYYGRDDSHILIRKEPIRKEPIRKKSIRKEPIRKEPIRTQLNTDDCIALIKCFHATVKIISVFSRGLKIGYVIIDSFDRMHSDIVQTEEKCWINALNRIFQVSKTAK